MLMRAQSEWSNTSRLLRKVEVQEGVGNGNKVIATLVKEMGRDGSQHKMSKFALLLQGNITFKFAI